MKTPKKILAQINRITLIEEVIKEKYFTNPDFINNPPDMWQKDEREMFDILADLEHKIKTQVLKILNPK
ncbi:hypothetical protein J2810_004586 [Chryseobacterium rhizosphaerae]|uniref:hypothetical protein n=1 Tax=Chryseobacterium rhizosphaerae TaxID=395937 RepID=UPI00286275F9|nr:hypothetical protein [Chryseobacterium rhizosphaerae]MDR6548496.1 hypothetical protein [Chryseobacterium rhizosphaerae]